MTNKGGTVYTIEIQTDEPNKEEIVERAVKITQSRIDAVGLDGEVSRVPDSPNQIAVKLYGAQDAERIKKFLFTANKLELKKVAGSAFQTYPTKEAAEISATKDQEVLPYKDQEALPYSERNEAAAQSFIIVEKQPVITGAELRTANAYSSGGKANDYQIQFTLRPEGAAKFGDWTGKNIGSYLAIVLDKKAISAPVIRGQIFDTGTIEGRFTKSSAEDLAISLQSGYLNATMKVLEEKPFE